MKPLCLAVLLSVGMLGCGKKETPKSELRVDIASGFQIGAAGTETLRLTDAQKIALLRAEAHKRGLRWRVFCSDDRFTGWAIQPGATWTTLAEYGAMPDWSAGGKTQADAAYNLYVAIKGAPNMYPSDWDVTTGHKKLCPPELRGE